MSSSSGVLGYKKHIPIDEDDEIPSEDEYFDCTKEKSRHELDHNADTKVNSLFDVRGRSCMTVSSAQPQPLTLQDGERIPNVSVCDLPAGLVLPLHRPIIVDTNDAAER